MTVHASDVSAIVLPVEHVALKYLKTTSGEPVVVRVERIDELAAARAIESLPGARPKKVDSGESQDTQRSLEAMLQFAPLVEASCVLSGPDGDVRPAFTFGHIPAHPLSIPGRLLLMSDLALLLEAAMRQNGYLVGTAGEGAFPDGERAGAPDGLGAVEPGTGDGANAVGGAA